MKKNITLKSNADKIVKLFRDATPSDTINLKTENGYIYMAGGILSKLEGNDHFVQMGTGKDAKWVKLWE